MDQWIERFRSAVPVAGQEKVIIPGDPERASESLRMKGGIPLNPKVVEEAGQTLRARLTLFNEQLKNEEWVAGAFSLADITLLVGIDFAAASQFQLDPAWTHLNRWYSAMKQRPSATA